MSCRAASPRVALRHAMTTIPPRRARPNAVALPIPEFAPVTRNTRASIFALKPRPRDEGIARLERLLARDPRCRFALLQVGPVDDLDPRHGLADEGVILKVLVRRSGQSAPQKAPVGTLSQEGINSNPRLWGNGFLTLAKYASGADGRSLPVELPHLGWEHLPGAPHPPP